MTVIDIINGAADHFAIAVLKLMPSIIYYEAKIYIPFMKYNVISLF